MPCDANHGHLTTSIIGAPFCARISRACRMSDMAIDGRPPKLVLDPIRRPNVDGKLFLSAEETARMLGVSKRTVSRWKEDGTLHTRGPGRKLWFDYDEVAELMRSRSQEVPEAGETPGQR